MFIQSLRNILLTAVAALGIGFLPSAKASIDYTDIWWAAGGAESGWGVNMAQSGDFIFATFFVYGPTGTPTWYTAQLSRTTGETFTGSVFVVSGTWFGAPMFPPVPPSSVVPVGNATFTASNTYTGTLSYSVNGVNVNKNIERQTTLGQALVQATYIGGMTRTYTGTCPTGVPTSLVNTVQLAIQPVQNTNNTVQFGFFGADSTNQQLFCAMQGNVVQHGKVLAAPGSLYQCANGINATAEIDSIRLLDNAIEMHWHSSVTSTCLETGRLSGAK
jgi:hypothetical protein